MGKRGIIVGIMGLLLLVGVVAQHDADVSFSSLTLYETTTGDFNITIGNFGSQDSITQVDVTFPGVSLLSAGQYSDWDTVLQSNQVSWVNGTIENNVLASLFEITARAGNVASDTQHTVTIDTTDSDGGTDTINYFFTVLNDASGPQLTTILPQDGDIILEGTSSLGVQANASDPQTGVKEVTFTYERCSGNDTTTSLPLTGTEPSYSGTTDVSNYSNNEELCFIFTGESNGGATTSENGSFFIDGENPAVSLVTPLDNEMMNSQSSFIYLPTDNLARQLECDLLVDGATEATRQSNASQQESVDVANISEGTHTWKVRCEDSVGLTGESSERTYTLDRTLPTITKHSPDDMVMAPGTIINVSVSDNFVVASVNYTLDGSTTATTQNFTIDTTGLAEGIYPLTITAEDGAGNIRQAQYNVTIDTTAPQIELLAPVNESDVNANYTFNVTDNYDTTLACSLIIDNSTVDTVSDVYGVTGIFYDQLTPGDYEWRVECEDGAGNTDTSETWNITILDLSGPTLDVSDIDQVLRGEDISVEINATDISGVSSVAAEITDSEGSSSAITLTQNGDLYTGTLTTTNASPTGSWTLFVEAEDNPGNMNNATETFDVTYTYSLDLTVSPSSAGPGDSIEASGTVMFDNGSAVPENVIELALPGETRNVSINGTSFGTTFSAPSAGTYTITSRLTAANGLTFSDSATLQVNAPSNGGSGGGDTSTRGSSGGSGGGSGDSGGYSISERSGQSFESAQTTDGEETEEDGQNELSDADDEASGDGERNPAVGRAAGLFDIAPSSLIWLVLAISALVGMYLYFRNDKKEKIGQDEWEEYFAKRR